MSDEFALTSGWIFRIWPKLPLRRFVLQHFWDQRPTPTQNFVSLSNEKPLTKFGIFLSGGGGVRKTLHMRDNSSRMGTSTDEYLYQKYWHWHKLNILGKDICQWCVHVWRIITHASGHGSSADPFFKDGRADPLAHAWWIVTDAQCSPRLKISRISSTFLI